MAWKAPATACVQVGVGEDDVRALAAQLEGGALERVGGRLLDDLGRIDVAGEGDLVDVGMRDQGGAGRLAEAVDDVDDAGGEAGLDGQLADPQGGQRRLLGGLHHDGVAAGQGRAPLPGEHQQREVPGDDLADDADRLAQRVRQEAAAHRDGLALDLVGPAGVVAQRVDDALPCRRCESVIVLPQLSDSSAASSSALLLDEVGQLEHAAGRGRRRPSCAQGPDSRAARAALTARSTSAAVPAATLAMTSPVAGLTSRSRRPRPGSTHSLSIRSRVWPTFGAVGRVATACVMVVYVRREGIRHCRTQFGSRVPLLRLRASLKGRPIAVNRSGCEMVCARVATQRRALFNVPAVSPGHGGANESGPGRQGRSWTEGSDRPGTKGWAR